MFPPKLLLPYSKWNQERNPSFVGPTSNVHRTTGTGRRDIHSFIAELNFLSDLRWPMKRRDMPASWNISTLDFEINISLSVIHICCHQLSNLYIACGRYKVARKPSQNTLLDIAMFNGLVFPLHFLGDSTLGRHLLHSLCFCGPHWRHWQCIYGCRLGHGL